MLNTTSLPIDTGMRDAARRPILWAAWDTIARTALGIVVRHRRRREIARAVNALSQLSDRQLADIGIHRSQIPGIARSGRDTGHHPV
jgi:uncharacterized protein YjiS (DUF1127 family)